MRPKGIKCKEEQKEHMRKLFANRKITWGDKISEAKKGKKYTYKNGVDPRKGKKLSKEHLKNMQNAIHKHHIDGDRTNNALDNILYCFAREHSKAHTSYYKMMTVLYRKDIIKFNMQKGVYELAI